MGEPEFAKINLGGLQCVYLCACTVVYIYLLSSFAQFKFFCFVFESDLYRAHFILFNTIVSLDNLYSKFFLNNIS